MIEAAMRLKRATDENDLLRADNAELKKENVELRRLNAELRKNYFDRIRHNVSNGG